MLDYLLSGLVRTWGTFRNQNQQREQTMKKLLKIAAVAAGVLAFTGSAIAHTSEVGIINHGGGMYTFWEGTYAHGAPDYSPKGGVTITGILGNPFPATFFPNVASTATDPVSNQLAHNGIHTEVRWQHTGVFSLPFGSYSYALTGSRPRPEWAIHGPWGVHTGTFHSSVPDAGATSLLLGLGVLGLAAARRRLR